MLKEHNKSTPSLVYLLRSEGFNSRNVDGRRKCKLLPAILFSFCKFHAQFAAASSKQFVGSMRKYKWWFTGMNWELGNFIAKLSHYAVCTIITCGKCHLATFSSFLSGVTWKKNRTRDGELTSPRPPECNISRDTTQWQKTKDDAQCASNTQKRSLSNDYW